MEVKIQITTKLNGMTNTFNIAGGEKLLYMRVDEILLSEYQILTDLKKSE